MGAEPVYEREEPAIAARAFGLKVGDVVIQLQTPTTDGELSRHLHRHGDGIRSTVFGVTDINRAKRYLCERGLAPVPGGAPNTVAVPADANLGLIFEFVQ